MKTYMGFDNGDGFGRLRYWCDLIKHDMVGRELHGINGEPVLINDVVLIGCQAVGYSIYYICADGLKYLHDCAKLVPTPYKNTQIN